MPVAEVVFWGACAAVLYAYLGYPIIIGVLARLRPAPCLPRSEETPRVTLVIVAHNEEESIGAKLEGCLSLDYPRELLEILVASDGSTDRTEEIVQSFGTKGVRLIALDGPKGKASCLNAVVPELAGDILVLADARQSLDDRVVRALVSCFSDPSVGAVSGELHLRADHGSAAMEGVGAYWRYEKWIRRCEATFDSTVGVTGALYAVRRSLYRALDPRTILDDVAVPMDVVKAGYRVLFEPTASAYDRFPESAKVEYLRKVRTLAGNFQLLALRPDLLDPRRNRLFWQFVSHKLLRLAVPWCLLAIFVSSAALSSILFYRLAFVLQGVLYSLAILGWAFERARTRRRLLSVPYAFAMLNLAAFMAFFVFTSGRANAAWKRTS